MVQLKLCCVLSVYPSLLFKFSLLLESRPPEHKTITLETPMVLILDGNSVHVAHVEQGFSEINLKFAIVLDLYKCNKQIK